MFIIYAKTLERKARPTTQNCAAGIVLKYSPNTSNTPQASLTPELDLLVKVLDRDLQIFQRNSKHVIFIRIEMKN